MKALLAITALFSLTGCTVYTTQVQVDWGVTATVSVGTAPVYGPVYPVYGPYYPPAYEYPMPIRQDRHGHWKTLPTPGMQPPRHNHPPRNHPPRRRR